MSAPGSKLLMLSETDETVARVRTGLSPRAELLASWKFGCPQKPRHVSQRLWWAEGVIGGVDRRETG